MEIWKPIKRFPNYNASTEGKIMNIKTQRIMRTFTNNDGYILVCLRKNGEQYTVRAARVIAETFLGERPGMDITYKNGSRSDIFVDNLEWCTRREAIQRSFENGDRVSGRAIPVRVIETGETYSSIRSCARSFGCYHNDICRCLNETARDFNGFHFERA